MTLANCISGFRRFLLQMESRIFQASGIDMYLAPSLAVQGPGLLVQPRYGSEESKENSFLDSVFWMAAPKTRRTIEVNRCRRRNENKLIPVKNNIVPCPVCGHLKLKHILCGFCYERVRKETAVIRGQIQAMEGRPLNSPAVGTVVLYENEELREGDRGKRTVETKRKRPFWFNTLTV